LYKNNFADPEILSSCEEVCLVQDRLKILVEDKGIFVSRTYCRTWL